MTISRYCPVYRCNRQRGPGKLMCMFHWAMVSEQLKRMVWQTYTTGTRMQNFEAGQAAIAEVNEQIKQIERAVTDNPNEVVL